MLIRNLFFLSLLFCAIESRLIIPFLLVPYSPWLKDAFEILLNPAKVMRYTLGENFVRAADYGREAVELSKVKAFHEFVLADTSKFMDRILKDKKLSPEADDLMRSIRLHAQTLYGTDMEPETKSRALFSHRNQVLSAFSKIKENPDHENFLRKLHQTIDSSVKEFAARNPGFRVGHPDSLKKTPKPGGRRTTFNVLNAGVTAY